MRAYFLLAPSKKPHSCLFLIQKFRESKADLDQFADLYCEQQGLVVDSSLNEPTQKSAKMKHFCDFIFNQCKPFQQQELCDAQERIRELEQQLVQAQKSAPASSSAQPPSKRASTEDPTPDNKKRRLPIAFPASQKPVKPAQTLLQKAFDPHFAACRVLDSQAPVSAVPQSTSKWIQNLNLDPKLKQELVQSCKAAAATVKSRSDEEREALPQRAAVFGFPVRLLTGAKEADLLKIVLAACALASLLEAQNTALSLDDQCRKMLHFILTVSKTCLQAAITEPEFMPWGFGFRVLHAFSVLVRLLRQTGNGKLARWRQGFQAFEEYRGQDFISAKHLTNLSNKPFAVYLVTSAQIEPLFQIGPDFYVGSTTVSVQKRQDSRLRKLRQLLNLKPVHEGLMLHWQVSHRCLGSLIATPLATMNTSRQIRTLEFHFNPKVESSYVPPNPNFECFKAATSAID